MYSLRGYLLLLMLLAVKASQDYGLLQREAELPLDLLDLLKQEPLVSHPEAKEGHSAPRVKPYYMDESIPFPLARPNMNNILAICRYSNLRPRYTKDMLPRNGFGYLHRQADAVNRLESWFTVCCNNGTQDDELTLCCAQQAWEKSLYTFCEDEFSIKTSHYSCCKKHGPARWDCFEERAPDPLYQPSEDEVPTSMVLPPTIQGFEFNPSSCQKTSVSEINLGQEMVTEPATFTWIRQRTVIRQKPVSDLSDYHVLSPRSSRPSITFPLAPPTTSNILAICQYSSQRPRYPKETLPTSGFGREHRQAMSVNQLESWYSVCCANGTQDVKQTLCCAQQAWVKSLTVYCEEEFTIKTSHYHCCRENGLAKWDCFEKEAENTLYQPSGHVVPTTLPSTIQGFDFDPNKCQSISISEVVSSIVAERTKRMSTTYIGFPPGRPNSDNIGLICAFRKYRPHYLTSCLLHTGFDRFAHHLKAMDSLEKGFGQCCKEKNDVQACAEEKWKKMVDRFCKEEKKVQVNQFECCKKQRGEERYDCFSTAAPKSYMIMNKRVPDTFSPSLNMFCDVYPALQKMKRLPFNVDEMAAKCCIREGDERTECLLLQLGNLLDDACEADNPSLAQVKQHCCKQTARGHLKCVTKLLMRNIAKAKRVNKKCPITV